ncbi:ABC transporter ATP-binding protein [Paenibacillus borealis]|uniref:GTPase n=1 Tax=Paenibacillus borealis TaxID=160799 RepID=A0A089MQ70_PAEBO|nr:ABC transporter ATP-binding protein [Paenibacillus borealis]AIQ58659.1 GTPase [Paenibacillus borealis]
MSILEISGVSKKYGSLHALKDITFSVEPGEWLSIMGSSGSGKSTMLNMIGLMDKPSSGQVKIDGIATSSMSSRKLTEIRKDKIGLVFQQFHLIPHLTALENVMVAQYYHSMPDEKEAAAALARVGLEGRAKHLPRQLSGGEQQRVCIARALINYPALILADEPTGNLDEANEEIVLDLFQELHQEGHTIIMVTHAPEVGELAERQIRLEHGVIKEIRMPDKVVAVGQELVIK